MIEVTANIKEKGRYYSVETTFGRIYSGFTYICDNFIISLKKRNKIVGLITGVSFTMGTYSNWPSSLISTLSSISLSANWLNELDLAFVNFTRNPVNGYMDLSEFVKNNWKGFRDKNIIYIDNILVKNEPGARHILRAMLKRLRLIKNTFAVVVNSNKVHKFESELSRKMIDPHSIRKKFNKLRLSCRLKIISDIYCCFSNLDVILPGMFESEYIIGLHERAVKYIRKNIF
jgi:hypothetical protein